MRIEERDKRLQWNWYTRCQHHHHTFWIQIFTKELVQNVKGKEATQINEVHYFIKPLISSLRP